MLGDERLDLDLDLLERLELENDLEENDLGAWLFERLDENDRVLKGGLELLLDHEREPDRDRLNEVDETKAEFEALTEEADEDRVR